MSSVIVRLAREGDIKSLETLIPLSVHSLQASVYSEAQRNTALGPVFSVDKQLIRDGTYFAAEAEGSVIACGGWSDRLALFGSGDGNSPRLHPLHDAARIRAFFLHPAWARQGIGSRILRACEDALLAAGFSQAELVATLAGEAFYRSHHYQIAERYAIELGSNQTLPVVRMTKIWK